MNQKTDLIRINQLTAAKSNSANKNLYIFISIQSKLRKNLKGHV